MKQMLACVTALMALASSSIAGVSTPVWASYESVSAALVADDLAVAQAKAAELVGRSDSVELDAAASAVKNAQNIFEARKAFAGLSALVITAVKGEEGYYVMQCPMFDNGIWVQDTDALQNPYMGQSMPSCGFIKGQAGASCPEGCKCQAKAAGKCSADGKCAKAAGKCGDKAKCGADQKCTKDQAKCSKTAGKCGDKAKCGVDQKCAKDQAKCSKAEKSSCPEGCGCPKCQAKAAGKCSADGKCSKTAGKCGDKAKCGADQKCTKDQAKCSKAEKSSCPEGCGCAKCKAKPAGKCSADGKCAKAAGKCGDKAKCGADQKCAKDQAKCAA